MHKRTRNIAFGSASTTSPLNSNVPSFAKRDQPYGNLAARRVRLGGLAGLDVPPRRPRAASGASDGVEHRRSDGAHVGGVRALGALLDLVLDLRALRERLKAAAGDRGVMHEHVLALIVGRDEPVALVVAEPFHDSRGHRPSLRSYHLNVLTDVRTSVLMTPASVSPDPAAGGAPGDVPQGGSFTGLPRCSNQATPRVRPKPAFAARHPPPVRSAAGENVQPAPPGPADARLQTRSRWRRGGADRRRRHGAHVRALTAADRSRSVQRRSPGSGLSSSLRPLGSSHHSSSPVVASTSPHTSGGSCGGQSERSGGMMT